MARINYSFLYQKKYQKKDNTHQVFLRVTILRKKKEIPLGFDVLEKNWDSFKQVVKRSDPDHFRKNNIIADRTKRISDIQLDHLDKPLSLPEFLLYFDANSYNSESFYSYIEKYIKRKTPNVAADTLKFYEKHVRKLKSFREQIAFSEINEDFIYSYRDYLKNIRGNRDSTMYKSLEFVKRVLNAAIKEGKIVRSPFVNIPIENPIGDKDHLSVDELNKLRELYESNTLTLGENNTLRHFLFACYTGMRWGDMEKFRFKHIHEDSSGVHVVFDMNKTKKLVRIPLIDEAIQLMTNNGLENQKVFLTYTNQTTGRHLKRIINKKLQIAKKISYHSARHTCHNLLIALEVPIEIREMILGDTKEVLNKFYTRPNIELIVSAMDKYSKALANKDKQD
jgi:integrase